MMRILLAEDERDLNRALCAVLAHEGYTAEPVYNGQDAVEKAAAESYDVIIMDIMMPVLDGVSALRRIRAGGDATPVIMLTAKSEVEDKIAGLDAGADDYLTKPFAMGELLARIRSMTRRMGSYTPTRLSAGNVRLDMEQQELSAENSIRLAGKETRMMGFLMLNVDKDLTTSAILHHVWREEEAEGELPEPSIVWIYISYLRQKLKAISGNLEIIGQEGGCYRLSQMREGSRETSPVPMASREAMI